MRAEDHTRSAGDETDGPGPAARYGVAVGAISVGVALALLLKPVTETTHYAPLFAAIAVGAWYGGTGPAIVAAALGAVLSVIFLVGPVASFDLGSHDDFARWVLFVVVGTLLAVLGGGMRAAERRARRAAREAEEARAVADAIFRNAPVGIGLHDDAGRFVEANAALAALDGISSEDHRGRALTDVLPGLPAGVRDEYGLVLERGRAISNWEVTGRTAADPSRERHWLLGMFRLDAPGSAVLGGTTLTDVTELTEAQGRIERLHTLTAALAGAASREDVAQAFVTQAVATGASAAVLALRDGDAVAVLASAGAADRAPARLSLAASSLMTTAIRDVRPVFVRHTDDASGREPEADPILGPAGRAALAVPLMRGAQVSGAIGMAFADAREFGAPDRSFALTLAELCAQALDRAELFERERHIARTLQRSLLPRSIDAVPGLEVATRHRAMGEGAEVGGDFYDVFPCAGGVIAVVGDVCGKGIEAAALTALARHTLRALSANVSSPAALLEGLNARLHEEQPDRGFVTVACARLLVRPGAVSVTAATGGHPPLLVVRADGRVEALGASGLLIGPFERLGLDERSTVLSYGDALVLYTDGLFEARRGGAVFGEERLRAAAARSAGLDADAIADRLEEATLAFQQGALLDDLAVLVVRAAPEAAGAERPVVTERIERERQSASGGA